MSIASKAVEWAKDIASDNKHGYSQSARWGPDYDCSSFVISSFVAAGLDVKSAGASSTASMPDVFRSCGFKDVTKNVTLSNGSGLVAGDVLWRSGHCGMTVGGGQYVSASSNKDGKAGDTGKGGGGEIAVKNYYNDSWTTVLRYS